MHICVTHVDAKTGIPCTEAPMSHGPAFPKVKGFKYEWANMTEWPTDRPLFFGTCDDDADVSIAGVIKTLTQEKYLSMRQTETDVKGMQVRRERDMRLITDVDSLNPIRWETLTTEKKEDFRAYRQELLDVPQQQGFPWDVQWPAQP